MPDPIKKLNLDLSGYKEESQPVKLNLDLSAYQPEKKKDGTLVGPKSASAPKTGSSATSETKGFPKIDMNSVAPGYGVQPQDEVLAQEQVRKNKVKALEKSFYKATKDKNDDAVAEQRTKDAINKEGFWNTVKDVSKRAINATSDFIFSMTDEGSTPESLKIDTDPLAEEKKQVKLEASKRKEKLSTEQINSQAAELYKQKQKESLFLDRANSFLDNLDEKDKELLKQDRAAKATHLQEDNAKKLKLVAAMQTVGNDKIKEYRDLEKQIKSFRENGDTVPEELYNQYASLGTQIKNIGTNISKYENEILKNRKDLGTAQEEFDLFKREYGDVDNFIGNVIASGGELLNNSLLKGGSYLLSLSNNPMDQAMSYETLKASNKVSGKLDEYRNALRKPVDEIESIEGFVNYASDLVANQIPNLVATSTGTKGLALIGTASAGQKFSDMKQEINEGKANYTPSQMAFAPLLYGGAEVISEIPTLSILKKGGRVLDAVAKNEAELLTKTAKQKAIEWSKDFGVDMSKEMAGEQFTNFAQNFNDKYVLGKKDVGLLDNTGRVFKDTFTLTSILKTAPHVLGSVIKPFQSNNELSVLDENSRKIIAFSQQLNTPGLTETEKTVIQKQIDKATSESATIMKNTIGKITDMPGVLYDEMISLNKQAGELKSQAEEIKNSNLENKQELLNGLKEEYKANIAKRNGIINGSTTVVDVLPLKEQEKLKKQALKELTAELNPDGSKNITIDNAQITERANKIYAKNESKQETPTAETQQEAQPKAKEQKTEQEVLTDESNNNQINEATEIKASEENIVETPNDNQINDEVKAKPIKQLGTGANVYFESDKYRVNDSNNGKTLLNVGEKNDLLPLKHIEFDDVDEAVFVAKKLEENAPEGLVRDYHNVDNIIENYKEDFKKQNEAIPSTNTPTDGTTAVGIEPNDTQGQNNGIQEAADTGRGESQTKVKKVKSVKDATYDVHFDEEGNVTKIISPKDGREIPKFREVTDKKTGKVKLQRNGNYSKIEADALGTVTENQAKEISKQNLKTALDNIPETDEYSAALKALATGNKVSLESIEKETGNKDGRWATNQSSKTELPSIEKLSEQIWENNKELDQQEIRNALIDIISSHSNLSEVQNSVIETYNDNIKKQQEEELRTFIGGLSEKDMAMYEAVKAEEDYISELTDEEAIEYFEQQYESKLQDYNEERKQPTANVESRKAESTSVQKRDGEKSESKPKSTTKEKIAIAEAKIDDIANWLKDVLPSADINPDDYDKQGIAQDQLIDIIAKAAKNLVAKGIEINDAIAQVVNALKQKFDFDVDIDAIKSKINPEKDGFTPKKGKKSLLNRLTEGGNSDAITDALKELSPNYDVRNQEKADAEAKAFIDKVGISEALYAAKNHLIPNADVRMLVYDEALTRLKDEIDIESEKNPSDRDALIQQFQELSDAFDNEVRNMGQGLAILNYIYNKNQSLKYNLKKVITDYKRNDPNGEIPAEVKAKFEELDQKLKDLEAKQKEAEERAKKAEEELAVKNVKEDVERKKQLASKNKSGLTQREVARKKELKNKFLGRFNDATSLVAMLADPEFREYLGLTFKQAKGDFQNFTNKILKELGKGAKAHLPQLFEEAQKRNTQTEQSISIDENGKIKIPAQLFRDLVEQGHDDINEIAKIIHETIKEEHPEITVREVRDALTGYGKQINPNKDEITAKINKLKEYGRLLSAYDDVINGNMPKKSGLKRLKPEQKARELRRDINRLAKELDIEPVDLEKQWASALEKVKSSLRNQIEDLDKQIANGEKRKVERTTTPLDTEAIELKEVRDAKKKLLDELAGKPELTEEQKIAKAEAALEKSIATLQEEIDTNNIAYKEKPTPLQSAKLQELRAKKKALLEAKKELRREAGLIEEQRLKAAKNRIRNQIEDLKTRIENKDFAKKEVKPLDADNELNTLRAEKEMIYEEYEKQKYLQELQNRSFGKKLADEALESLGLLRAVKASLDLGLIGIQLRGFTYAELLRNPVELGRKFVKLFGAIGSQSKTNKAMANIIGHPLYSLAKKLDIGITHPDLRNEVREEMASGNLLHLIWNLPIHAAERFGGEKYTQKKRTAIGDAFVNAAKKQYNKLFTNSQLAINEKEKFSAAEQWSNMNVFEAVERGLSTYGNQLRFEEFIRGVERLKAEGKDEINHPEDYKALASYIRTFSGRAKPAGFEMNQKALNVFFFSFKNAASVFQQLNPIYYLNQHVTSSDFKNGNYTKMSVANKMAMATMFKSVASTSATLLFLMAGYNAMKDDDDEEATIERDPRSSDFGKFKIGDFRYDPWGGYIPLITLYARLLTEESKKSDGSVYKFGEERFGVQNRGDAAARFLFNKESPGAQAVHHYLVSTEKVDEKTGESYRADGFGNRLSEDEAYSLSPIFMGSVRDAVKNDFEGVKMFLTAYSVLGLGNVQYYKSKEGTTPEDKMQSVMEKRRLKGERPKEEKIKEKVSNRLDYAENKIKELEYMKMAQQLKIPYYTPSGVKIDVSTKDFSKNDASIEKAKKTIQEAKNKYQIDK